jgi:hypothetical protein
MSGHRGGTEAHKGDWNVICDLSGFKCKASETVLRWDGLRVLRRFSEGRQPQDFVRGVRDNPGVRWTRPEAADTFISSPVRPEDL